MSRSKKKKHTAEPVLASPASTDEQDPVAPVWSRKARIIASLLVSFHIFAIFIAPMAFPRPSSELSRSVAKIAEPYYVAGFLGHGYRFFAPNPPSASFIVRYRLTMPDGTNREGEFPNLKEHRPRLLYHRHFMLSGTVQRLADFPEYDPAQLASERQRWLRAADDLADQELHEQAASCREQVATIGDILRDLEHPDYQKDLKSSREIRDRLLEGIGRQLLARHGATRCELFLFAHDIPSPEAVSAGQKLDDDRSYRMLRPLGVYEGDTP